jgi:tetratricopeptide (TPR) repeat protein
MFLGKRVLASSILVLVPVALRATPQRAAPQATPHVTSTPKSALSDHLAHYSQDEPFIIEQSRTAVRFENDGTGERDLAVHARVQSAAGAQQFREIVFACSSPNERIDVRSVTVRKPDGSAINALTADAIKEAPSAVARDAPAYANYKEVHVAVPSLQPGDVLEYDVATRLVKPFAQGQFWFQYNFLRDAIVLDERVELNLPQGHLFSLKSPGLDRIAGKETHPNPSGSLRGHDVLFTRADEKGRTILRWKHTNLTRVAQDDEQAPKDPRAEPPDLQLTSFESWDAVARWYFQLETNRSEPAPEIRAKVQELVRGATTDVEKEKALCEFVSKKIRYVNLSFGLAGFCPHSAADVLANGYGDSKDKNVLLMAMLEAAGIRADAGLIPYSRRLDTELPSPAQFDMIITAIPQNGKLMWMDATHEVAPFRFLPASLRSKFALLVPANGPGKVVETPADPPFPSTQDVDIDGRVSDLGKLVGTAHYSVRGDMEFALRTAFRRTAQAQWNQLGQTILTLDGLRGQISGVTTSDPLDTEKAFELNIEFSDLNVLNWPNKKAKMVLPLLTISTPDSPKESDKPVKLGTPLHVTTRLKLSFPPNFTVQPPVGVAVARDYAEFQSTYRFEANTLIAERSLNLKIRELPASRTPDYLTFAHAVQADAGQILLVENPAADLSKIPEASADDLCEAGAAALQSGNARVAIPLLQRATQLQPEHKQAWSNLGLAYMRMQEFEPAAAAFRKQAAVNPSDEHADDYLGLALERLQRDDEAAATFRKQIKSHPLDMIAYAALGSILLAQHKYSEAVPELEKATILSPEDAGLEVNLGRAYLNSGDKEKAVESFRKGVDLSPTPRTWNDVAFSLAEQGIELDKAQQYAESAISTTATQLEKVNASHATAEDFAQVANVGDYWDTLGWIYFQRGDLPKAERYIRAAWLLNQRGEVGDHLAQTYEKSGKKELAVHQCALALAAPDSVQETRARLMLLLGGNSQIDDLVSKARPELEKMRTFIVKQPSQEEASADFLVLMSPSAKEGGSPNIDAVRFLTGSESLRVFEKFAGLIDYGPLFPDASPVKLLRRGTLSCSAKAGDCKFTLWLPADVPGTNR